MTMIQHHPRRGTTRSTFSLLAGLSVLWTVSGCPSPDPAGKYERFNTQTEDERDRPEPKLDFGAPIPMDTDTDDVTVIDVNGVYLLAVDTSVNPGLPLQFLAEVMADYDETGTGTITVEFQPLSLDVMSTTEPREEVGEALVITSDMNNFSFVLDFGETMVTGEANPITGSDIVAEIVLEGAFRNADAFCGISTGNVLSPIQVPLDGSTFGAMRLADRDERPGEGLFPVSCETVDELGIGQGGDEGTTTGM